MFPLHFLPAAKIINRLQFHIQIKNITVFLQNFLIDRIMDFLYIDAEEPYLTTERDTLPQPGLWIGTEHLTVPDVEDAYLLGIVRALAQAREVVNENIPIRRRNYRTKLVEKEKSKNSVE